jgi:hypothetical protein
MTNNRRICKIRIIMMMMIIIIITTTIILIIIAIAARVGRKIKRHCSNNKSNRKV